MFASISVGGRGRPTVLVLGCFKGEGLDRASQAHDSTGAVARAIKRGEATGEVGSIVEAFPESGPIRRVIVAGLGPRDALEPGHFRTIAGAVGRRLAQAKEASAQIEFGAASTRCPADACGVAFGEGLGLIGWTCDQFRGSGTRVTKRSPLRVSSSERAFESGMRLGAAMAEGSNLARTLSQTPPNIATPAYMAGQARALARRTGMSCRVIEGAQLRREGLIGHIAVGQASENKPCLVRLEYRPRGASRGAKPVVFVGKTMCYDTGGLSLKINNGMKGMKRDKDGGCAVLGAMQIIASVVKPSVPVVALLCCAENSISDEAYRPDDILTYANGVTVEVTNTDAEGRLVLADGLIWACARENPLLVADIATLTGGVVVALGSVFAGMWCDDDALRGRVEAAAALTGEPVWRLPLNKAYRDMMKSPVADIVNSAPVREAHPIQGAAFLASFVPPGVPWVHLDIAGTHNLDRDSGPHVAGPTGFGARLLARLAESAGW
ncbi:MAG: leucyl aminopeptidase family protein [Phycisphaeraceae bacterium]|nr:leucyl aminopeptidase family protein [Phycisphaeraceae bacterium]